MVAKAFGARGVSSALAWPRARPAPTRPSSSSLRSQSVNRTALVQLCGHLCSPLNTDPHQRPFRFQGHEMELTFHSHPSSKNEGTFVFSRTSWPTIYLGLCLCLPRPTKSRVSLPSALTFVLATKKRGSPKSFHSISRGQYPR